jgi:hypothetical protein
MRLTALYGPLTAALFLLACGDDNGGATATAPIASEPVPNQPSNPASPELQDIPPANPPIVDDPLTETPAAPSDAGGPLPNVFSPQITASPFAASGRSLEEFPTRLIVSGGVPKDGIPALSNPSFAADASFLNADDLVLGVVINGQAKAYPHNIGWWHEIVNDRVGGHPISVTFCPLTGTGLVFDAQDEDGSQFELGVSGLLFNNNLIMYDRRDGRTLYPQLYFTGIEGPRHSESLTLLPVVETRWGTWKRLHPETQVVAGGTYNRSQYTRYPYGDYRVNDSFLIFGLSPLLGTNPNPVANLFGAKDRVLGLRLNGQAKAYPFDQMGKRQVINDQVGGIDIVVLWDRGTHLALPFSRKVGGQTLNFDIDQSAGFPFQLVDRETETRWNANGIAVEGPLAETKQRLTQVPAHNSMWFAWVTFWQDTDVWAP